MQIWIEVIAWKNGLFQFDGANITDIMREIGRWYDVDIEYADKVPVRGVLKVKSAEILSYLMY